MVVPLRSNISKMQIMTPAPLTSCAFVYVRENDNYYEKKITRETYSLWVYQARADILGKTALGLNHISPTRWLILCPLMSASEMVIVLLCFMGFYGVK